VRLRPGYVGKSVVQHLRLWCVEQYRLLFSLPEPEQSLPPMKIWV
jgi:hypothetical protein